MLNSDEGLLLANAASEAMILGGQVSVFGTDGGMGGLIEEQVEGAIALAGLTRATLAGTFMVARGNVGPGSQVVGAVEAGHIHANLGDDAFGGLVFDVGDGIDHGDGGFKRAAIGLNLFIEASERLVD